MNHWQVVVEEDEKGNPIIPLPREVCDKYNLRENDEIPYEVKDNALFLDLKNVVHNKKNTFKKIIDFFRR